MLERALKPDRAPLLFPDLPLDSAIPYLARWPVLPIQNRASKGTLEGIVSLEDVLRPLPAAVGDVRRGYELYCADTETGWPIHAFRCGTCRGMRR